MTDLLIYDLDDFTPTGTLCNYKVTAQVEETKIMPNTPLCRILGLQPLIPLLQYVNRLGFEICSVNRTRKLGYVNLNWPRCSAWVTESLVLTDGSFYSLDYVKIVSL